MKKIFIILPFIVTSFAALSQPFSQNGSIKVSGFDSTTGRPGFIYTLKPTNYLYPFKLVNDSTVGIWRYLSTVKIAWPGTLFSTPTTSTFADTTATLTPVLATQSPYTLFGNNTSGTSTPTFFVNNFSDSLRRQAGSLVVERRVNGVWIPQYTDSSGGGVGGAGWALAGNSITAGTDFFGTINNASIRFRTNNTEVGIMDSTGKFGWGTMTPRSKFHLVSNNLPFAAYANPSASAPVSSGMMLENTTPGTASIVQSSPPLIFKTQAYNTSLSSSKQVSFRLITYGVSAGGVAANFSIEDSLDNAASWTTKFKIDNQISAITTPFAFQSSLAGGDNKFNGYIDMYNNGIYQYIRFAGLGTASNAIIGHDYTTGDLKFRTGGAISLTTGSDAMNIKQTTGNILLNTSTDNGDAALDIGSVYRGFMKPRVTTAQRDSMNLQIASFTVVDGGKDYATGPSIAISGSTTYGVIPGTVGTITRVGNAITAVAVFAPGSYNFTPTITVTGGGGSGAVIVANMTQVLRPGLEIFCTDCTPDNYATNPHLGVTQTWNGYSWINAY